LPDDTFQNAVSRPPPSRVAPPPACWISERQLKMICGSGRASADSAA
jgi:hypothetical protein